MLYNLIRCYIGYTAFSWRIFHESNTSAILMLAACNISHIPQKEAEIIINILTN